MSLTTVRLSALRSTKGNPRRTVDTAQVASLARSIRADGLLQNLVVRPEFEDSFRVISGKRRYLALQLLKKEGHIDENYLVPVEIKHDLNDADALRIATVENVQREQLHPMDEAEAFAKLLQNGGTIETITEKTGLSPQTVKRRIALAALCTHAKKALRAGEITLSVAEALTLGTPGQQRSLLESFDSEDGPDAEDIRIMLLEQKPNAAMAIFPMEQYTGSFTTDLFSDDETTYFDDVDQFLNLQRRAAEILAENYEVKAAWVETFNLYTVPWWQYGTAEAGAKGGVVINLHPSGTVEVREGLVRHEVKKEVEQALQTSSPRQAKERPVLSVPLLRYVAHQKSIAVQAALLGNPRKAKELAIVLLLAGGIFKHGLRLLPHPCATRREMVDGESSAFMEVERTSAILADLLGFPSTKDRANDGIARLLAGDAIDVDIYDRLPQLPDDDLERLIVFLPALCFGQDDVDTADDDEDSFFNRVASDLAVSMRNWWRPNETFLNLLRRDQLHFLAKECEAGSSQGIKTWSKKELVQAFSRKFATADVNEEDDGARWRSWTPGIFEFPARQTLSAPVAKE